MGSKPDPRWQKCHLYAVLMRTLDNEEEPEQREGIMYSDGMGNLNFEDRISGIRHMRRPMLEFDTGEPMTFIGFVRVDDDLWVCQSWQILHFDALEVDQ
jgi:hypothetical protein